MRSVRMEAVLTGPAEHRQRVRRLFGERGWEVLDADEEAYPEVAPDESLPSEVDRKSVYRLLIPVDRDADRPPELWATQKVKDLADGGELDLRPAGVEMQRRQRRLEPHWFVCAPPSTHANPWIRWLRNLERRMGLHDTGTVLFGSKEEVERQAGPGRVRPPFPRRTEAHNGMHRTKVAEGRRQALKAAVLLWASGALGIPAGSGVWWLALPAAVACALLIWWCAITLLPFVRRSRTEHRRRVPPSAPDGSRGTSGDGENALSDEEVVVHDRPRTGQAWLMTLGSSGFLFAATAFSTWAAGPVTALRLHLLLAGAVFVTAGVRRLVRAGSRRPFLVAIGVALLPVALPALDGLSPVLFTFYGAAFHVRAEEMDVAEVWQFLASANVLVVSVMLMLVFLACWGYAQPFFRSRTPRAFLPIIALVGVMTLTLAWMVTALDSPSAAGDQAVKQWRSGRVPDHYYGATPRPVCVTPIGPLSELALYGQRLHPERVYGAFGVVDGQVTLWDPASGDAFPVPADAVQVLTAGDGKPGASIPRTCRSRA